MKKAPISLLNPFHVSSHFRDENWEPRCPPPPFPPGGGRGGGGVLFVFSVTSNGFAVSREGHVTAARRSPTKRMQANVRATVHVIRHFCQ